MKLAVVGGGSTYTPELIDGIAGRRSTLDVDEIVLVDPDAYRVEAVGGFSQRILDHAGHPEAGVAVTFPGAEADDTSIAQLAQLVIAAAAEISRRIGGGQWLPARAAPPASAVPGGG